MNNAGVAQYDGKKGTSWENRDVWAKVINSNVVGCVSIAPRSSNTQLNNLLFDSESSTFSTRSSR